MHNYLLDRYPTEYGSYLIRSDFRIGMQIYGILTDPDLEEAEMVEQALTLLYGEGVPDDIQFAMNGLCWFLSCGKSHNIGGQSEYLGCDDVVEESNAVGGDNGKVAYDFEVDSGMIYSSMFQQYGIRLDRERMHWFEFSALFAGLKDTALNDLMYYRTVDLDQFKGKQRSEMTALQNKYRIRKVTAERKRRLMMHYGTEWRDYI